MKNRATKLLSLALAFTLAASPASGLRAYATEPGDTGTQPAQEAAETQTAQEAVPYASDPGTAAPSKPTLPEGFSEALEEGDGLTLAAGATAAQMNGCGKTIQVASHWNNQNGYYASFNNAASLFKTTAFTVLFDVRQDPPSGDANVTEQRTAMTIGTADNSIHLLTYAGQLGYGGHDGGKSTNKTDLTGVAKDGWNAVAMTYEEANNGNGHIIVYVNGQKSAEVADIGFKLSTMDNLTAMIARTFGTSYLQEGIYDNLVVGNSVESFRS